MPLWFNLIGFDMDDQGKRIVVALGGNAISLSDEEGNIDQQFAHTRQTAALLADAIAAGHHPVITHGNGPQVGNVLRRVELASSEMYAIPLEICVADTQAGMGYMIGQCLTNTLRQRGLPGEVATVISSVVVDADDPAFAKPDKPIGRPMGADVAVRHRDQDGWVLMEVDHGRYRRIVPSPVPRAIVEIATIRRLVDDGLTVIACGGGGIPVVQDDGGNFRGAAAVIDKDRTAALLALELDAQVLVILTAVEHVYLNYRQPNQQAIGEISADELQRHLDAGQFPPGSMRPKVESAIAFVRRSPHDGACAVIAELNQLIPALSGDAGTRVVK